MPCRGAPEPSLPEDRAGPPLAPKLRGSCQPKWRHPVCRKTSDGCRRVARASKPQPLRGADNSLHCACSSSVPAGGAARGRRKKKKKTKKRVSLPLSCFALFGPAVSCCSVLEHFFSCSLLFPLAVNSTRGCPIRGGTAGRRLSVQACTLAMPTCGFLTMAGSGGNLFVVAKWVQMSEVSACSSGSPDVVHGCVRGAARACTAQPVSGFQGANSWLHGLQRCWACAPPSAGSWGVPCGAFHGLSVLRYGRLRLRISHALTYINFSSLSLTNALKLAEKEFSFFNQNRCFSQVLHKIREYYQSVLSTPKYLRTC